MPELEEGLSSARRKPVWMFVEEGAKMELSERVISTGMVFAVVSKREEGVMAGSWMSLLNARSARVSFGWKEF